MRSRWWVVVAVCAAVAGVVGTVVTVLPDDPAGPAGDPAAAAPAGGGRLVGLGHAAIAVPGDWGTNRTSCGVPQQDTVVIDVGAVPACGTARPEGVESVEVVQGPPRFDFEADGSFRVDGVVAERQQTTCAQGGFGGGRVCTGTVYLPAARVSFRAESSTGAASVERILERIRIVPDRVGVPGFQPVALHWQGRAARHYVQTLRRMGLRPEVTRRERGAPAGFVLGVSPAPGTMVRPGTAVTVSVAAG
jgi:hypothetical protein